MRRSRSRRSPAATKPRVFGLEKAIIGLLILATFAFAVIFMAGESLIHRDPKTPPPEPARIELPPSPMEPAALAALEAFFEAPDLTAKATLVRDSARVRPMMENYHDQRGHSFPTLGRVSPGHAASFDGTPMVLFEVEPFSGPRYPVAVAWDGHRFGVDWESLTAYGTMDWSEFIEHRPVIPQTLRVFVTKMADDQKAPGLPSGAGQFQIEHRDDSQPIIALADATLTDRLTSLIEGTRSPITLEMAWKPIGLGGTPVACVTRVVSARWSR
jgi:hypothetical protein